MYKIGILFENREFEHDVYELIKAFYPEAEIHTLYEDDEAEYDLRFCVERDNENYFIKYDRKENPEIKETEIKGVASVEVITDSAVKDPHALRKENKDSIKYALYQLLVKLTGRTLPWGNLTGIRPAKLAMGMIESGMKNTEAAQEMREKYLVSPQKTALAITIANREREILKDIDYENGYSLYIGIPFCPSICLYCSFSSYPLKVWEKRSDEYVEALCKEVRETALMMKGRKLDTIYIGGGTPTTLLPHQIRKLLDTVGEAFGYEGLAEFTVEAGRPDSITREKLMAIREYPVTRISVNPQTMNQETLEIIGRKHTVDQTKEAFHLARELGFDNINMDLIVGLPGEDIHMVERTLEQIRELAPDSMTVHSLAVKRAARLNIFKEKYQEMLKSRKVVHDMKNHLLALKKYDQERDWEGLHQYLNELSDDMLDDSYQIWTGNRMLDMILNQKTKDAKEKETDMQIETEVFATLPFSDREIISLFGNVLDNALEACERIQDKKRWIKIKIKKKNHLLYIETSNAIKEMPVQNQKEFVSVKEDEILHGYGMKNIQDIVRKYDGIFRYKIYGEYLVCIISIYDIRGAEEE